MSTTTEKWTIFGERLKTELERQEMSLRQFAEKAGLTLTTACRYVHSQRTPRATEILKAAKVLGVTCDYMLGLSDDPHKTRDGWSKAGFHELPSAQPETHEERTETHACDCISRQVAINALTSHIMPHNNEDGTVIIGVLSKSSIKNILNKLPSAQPEPCVDTIDALDESIKHFDDMAEECRRNANIEQNDYMDMRDDAAEYRQLSIWLNELKWLRERFQSQPDLSEYSDKLWKKAYERGKAETLAQLEEAYISGETEAEARFHAQQRWIPCSERLPEENGQYLITVKYVHVDGYDDIYAEHGEWTDGKWDMFCFGHCGKVENIIAWMPLPEPYAERRTDG